MPEFTEGVCGDGAAILRDGQPMTITEILEELAEGDRLRRLINTPETDDWIAGAALEAAHQIERWGEAHDSGKSAWDWFWLIGYLAQKAAAAQVAGDVVKARHHTISTAAALLNWHRRLTPARPQERTKT
jgi:hypothetical protein